MKRKAEKKTDYRKFLSMTDGESKDFAAPKAFVSIGKQLVEIVELLEREGDILS